MFAIIQFAFYILNKYKFEQKLKKLYLFKHYQHLRQIKGNIDESFDRDTKKDIMKSLVKINEED